MKLTKDLLLWLGFEDLTHKDFGTHTLFPSRDRAEQGFYVLHAINNREEGKTGPPFIKDLQAFAKFIKDNWRADKRIFNWVPPETTFKFLDTGAEIMSIDGHLIHLEATLAWEQIKAFHTTRKGPYVLKINGVRRELRIPVLDAGFFAVSSGIMFHVNLESGAALNIFNTLNDMEK